MPRAAWKCSDSAWFLSWVRYRIRRPHWRRACGTIGQLDMKLKVNSQVSDTIISLACLSQVSLKQGPPFPPRTQAGSLRPPQVRLGWVPVPPAPSLGSWEICFAWSFPQFLWKAVFPNEALCNFTGHLWFRMKLPSISLEIYLFAWSSLQFHWKSMCSHGASCNFTGNLWFRIKL